MFPIPPGTSKRHVELAKKLYNKYLNDGSFPRKAPPRLERYYEVRLTDNVLTWTLDDPRHWRGLKEHVVKIRSYPRVHVSCKIDRIWRVIHGPEQRYYYSTFNNLVCALAVLEACRIRHAEYIMTQGTEAGHL